MYTYTHEQVIAKAARWAKKKYPVVITEIVSTTRESPDVLAFGSNVSVVIECKISRSDFLKDKKKSFRKKTEMGMGRIRYYCAPAGIIEKHEVPDNWGLLIIGSTGKAITIKKPPNILLPYNAKAEIACLVSLLRRVGDWPHSICIKCYEHETRRKASVSIQRYPRPKE